LTELCEVRALMVEVRLTWPKLTPRLCMSEGRTAMTGGLLGQLELVNEWREIEERRVECLLVPDRVKLELE